MSERKRVGLRSVKRLAGRGLLFFLENSDFHGSLPAAVKVSDFYCRSAQDLPQQSQGAGCADHMTSQNAKSGHFEAEQKIKWIAFLTFSRYNRAVIEGEYRGC